MSDSSGTNSWTVVTPEETTVETLRSQAELAEQHEGSNPSAEADCTGSVEGSAVEKTAVDERQGLEDPSPSTEDPSPSTEDPTPSTEDPTPSTEDPTPSTEDSTPINEDPTPTTEEPAAATSHGPPDPPNTSVADDPHPPSSLNISGPASFGDDDAHSQSEGLPEGRAATPPSPEADTFSDSYTHVSPSPEEPPASASTLLTPETLGGEGLTQGGGGGASEREGLGQEEEEESERSRRATDSGKHADSPVVSEGWEQQVGEEEKEKEGDAGLRRRRTLLTTIGRSDEDEEEEDEEEEEEFQPPQPQGEEFSFSLNKCILGALILLGIGTIFFSGIFIDVDENEYDAYMELRDAEIPVKQEWSTTEGPPSLTDEADLLNKLDRGTGKISDPPAQLQAHQEDLKASQGQAMEGTMLEQREEQDAAVVVEEEENVAAAVPDTGGATETPTGHTGDSSTQEASEKAPEKKQKDKKKEKFDSTAEKERKEREKRERKEREKAEKKRKEDGGWGKEEEWKEKEKGKKRKYEREEEGGKDWKHKEEKKKKKEWKEKEEWKKGGGEGKQWKGREGKGRDEGKDWKKKDNKQEKWSDGGGREGRGKREEWKDKKKSGKEQHYERKEEERGWKSGKEEGGKKKEKHWKEDGRHRDDEREWKERDQKKHGGGKRDWKKEEWKKEGKKKEEWGRDGGGGRSDRDKHDKGHNHHHNTRREDHHHHDHHDDHHNHHHHHDDHHNHHRNTRREHHDHDDHHHHHHHHDEKVWHAGKGAPSRSSPPSIEHPDYWLHQKHKLEKNVVPTHSAQPRCDSVESCARAQGLTQPVHHDQFMDILQGYLGKAEAAGATEPSVTEELRKLASEFFPGPTSLFAHHLMSFRDFTEDVGDILEDMVEREEQEEGGEEEEEEDSALEQEMDGFEEDVMRRFGAPKEEGVVGKRERRVERGRG